MTKEEVIVQGILDHTGGKDNIKRIAHCMTRIRLEVHDYKKVRIADLKKVEGVMGVVEDDTLQIIVGPGTVTKVAEQLCRMTGLDLGEVADSDHVADDVKQSIKKE